MNMWVHVQHLCRQAPVQCSVEGFATTTSTPTRRSTLKFDRPSAYRLLRRRGHATSHLAKFKSNLKIARTSECTMVAQD